MSPSRNQREGLSQISEIASLIMCRSVESIVHTVPQIWDAEQSAEIIKIVNHLAQYVEQGIDLPAGITLASLPATCNLRTAFVRCYTEYATTVTTAQLLRLQQLVVPLVAAVGHDFGLAVRLQR